MYLLHLSKQLFFLFYFYYKYGCCSYVELGLSGLDQVLNVKKHGGMKLV